jgi:hypothetical protein
MRQKLFCEHEIEFFSACELHMLPQPETRPAFTLLGLRAEDLVRFN